jgi:apoptosis-inducing factor 3
MGGSRRSIWWGTPYPTSKTRHSIDYIGHAECWDDIIVHGDIEKPEFLAYYVKDGVVAAACGLDRDRDTAALIELMTMRRDWTASELGERPAALLAGALSR